jgi:hypothetical protein
MTVVGVVVAVVAAVVVPQKSKTKNVHKNPQIPLPGVGDF